MRYKLVVIIGFFLWSSCAVKSKEQKSLDTFVAHYSKSISNYNKILIIPLDGCNSCIEQATIFFKENNADKNILFVLTTYKPFNHHDIMGKKYGANVISDTSCEAQKLELIDLGPKCYYIENSQISEVREILSRDNI